MCGEESKNATSKKRLQGGGINKRSFNIYIYIYIDIDVSCSTGLTRSQ